MCLIILLVGIFNFSYSQVGIGTTNPNTNAMLDVDVSSLAVDAKKALCLQE